MAIAKEALFKSITLSQILVAHILRVPLKYCYRSRKLKWAIGPVEIAGVASSLSAVLEKSKTFFISSHPFYSLPKARPAGGSAGFLNKLELLFSGPYFLAKISAQFEGAVYIGNLGYLVSRMDQREQEFRFLRRYGLKIVCVLTGSDIRSVTSMLGDAKISGSENIASYLALASPQLATESHERVIEERCKIINHYADLVFTSPFDQKSYLRDDAKTFTPFLPAEKFSNNIGKFFDSHKLIVVHAPSSPAIKGTPLVRAAVSRLKKEGFEFEYMELQGVRNSEVISHLRKAHVVLNEFYAFVPGVFGVEGLANSCVVLTRASHVHDPTIPGNPEEAWIPTEPNKVYDNLRWVLEHPSKLERIATSGYNWALDYAHEATGGQSFAKELEILLASSSSPL